MSFALDRGSGGPVGPPLDYGVGEVFDHNLDRTHRVVVAGNDHRHVIRIGLGVGQRHDRNVQPIGLSDGVLLAGRVHHDQGPRHAVHGPDAVQVPLHLAVLALDVGDHLLRVLVDLAAGLQFVEFIEVREAGPDRAEIRERSAQPAVTDVWHGAAFGFLLDGGPGLALGAHEDDVFALGHHTGQEFLGPDEPLDGFLDVNDVDEVSPPVDVWGHLGVPPAGRMPKMDPGVNQILHLNLQVRQKPFSSYDRRADTRS